MLRVVLLVTMVLCLLLSVAAPAEARGLFPRLRARIVARQPVRRVVYRRPVLRLVTWSPQNAYRSSACASGECR